MFIKTSIKKARKRHGAAAAAATVRANEVVQNILEAVKRTNGLLIKLMARIPSTEPEIKLLSDRMFAFNLGNKANKKMTSLVVKLMWFELFCWLLIGNSICLSLEWMFPSLSFSLALSVCVSVGYK